MYDEFPDPNRYIPKSRHGFIYVTKSNAKAEIDKICRDLFMNYMVNMKKSHTLFLQRIVQETDSGPVWKFEQASKPMT
jgi:hypothetical protein